MSEKYSSQTDLAECRQKYGNSEERKFSIYDRLFYLNIRKPSWCDSTDELEALFRNKWDLLENGNIVWGCIVQANVLLFEKGNNNCPASVVFSPNPATMIDLDTLAAAAKSIYSLKNTIPDDPKLKKIANTLTNELTRTFGVKVPKELCSKYDLYESTCFISRKHLPNKVLSRKLFPILVSNKQPYYCIPLPSRFWPDSLKDNWYD